MKACEDCPGEGVRAVARTMTTVIVAVASMLVLALAGCANPRGIEAKATLVAPATLGADPAAGGRADRRRLVARLRRSGPRRPDRARHRRLAVIARRRRARARASANVASAHAAEGPQLTGSFDATRQRFTANGLYPPPLAGSLQTPRPRS